MLQKKQSVPLQAMGSKSIKNGCHAELNDKQMENRKSTCKILRRRHDSQSVLHRIVTGSDKVIYFLIHSLKKSWVDWGELSTSAERQC